MKNSGPDFHFFPCMNSNIDIYDPKPAEVNGDFFPCYEWILDYVPKKHEVLNQDLNHNLITDNFIYGYRTGL